MTIAAINKHAPGIPKLVHRIWFGAGLIPKHYEMCWESWQRQLPDFEFRTWRPGDIAGFRTAQKIAAADGRERKEHIALYEILLTHGGICLDGDIAPYHRFGPGLLAEELVVCSEIDSDSYCSMGFVAASPGAAAMAWAVDTLLQKELNLVPPNVETGPWLLQQALKHGAHTKLPAPAFYPCLLTEPGSASYQRDLSATYGSHVLGGLRLNERQKIDKVREHLNLGDLKGTVDFISGMESPDLAPVLDFCTVAKTARAGALEAAKHEIAADRLNIGSQRPLDLLKLGFFLLSQIPDLLIWQIGAAADPLRPLLVNFDPAALLAEPNPALYKELAANYRNNRQARLVGAAGADIDALLQMNPQVHPGIVVVNIKGMDFELVKQVLIKGITPFILQFEASGLSAGELHLLATLLEKEYVTIFSETAVVAYRTDFLGIYCDHLYVEHGIPTIYRDALNFVLHLA